MAALTPGRASEGKAAIEEAMNTVQNAYRSASLAEFFARVKAQVEAKKDCGVVRMQVIMRTGPAKFRVASSGMHRPRL